MRVVCRSIGLFYLLVKLNCTEKKIYIYIGISEGGEFW